MLLLTFSFKRSQPHATFSAKALLCDELKCFVSGGVFDGGPCGRTSFWQATIGMFGLSFVPLCVFLRTHRHAHVSCRAMWVDHRQEGWQHNTQWRSCKHYTAPRAKHTRKHFSRVARVEFTLHNTHCFLVSSATWSFPHAQILFHAQSSLLDYTPLPLSHHGLVGSLADLPN